MSKDEFEILVNEVLGRLMELSPQFSPEIVDSMFNQCMVTWDTSQKNARIMLLTCLLKQMVKCEACPRHKQRINPAIAEGALDSIMLVGDYPGYLDNLTGRVFSGIGSTLHSKCGSCIHLEKHVSPLLMGSTLSKEVVSSLSCKYEPVVTQSRIPLPMVFTGGTGSLLPLSTAGQVLDRLLLDAGLVRSSWGLKPNVYITNVLLCPSMEENGDNLPVTAAERKACRPWFDIQLKVVKPKLVICMGKEAYAYFFPKDKLTENIGKLRAIGSESFLVGATYHPGMVVRNQDSPKADVHFKDISSHLDYYVSKFKEMNNE